MPVLMPIGNDRERVCSFEYAANEYAALKGADALAVITDWHEYRHPDFARIKTELKQPVIIDARNLDSIERMKGLGMTDHLTWAPPSEWDGMLLALICSIEYIFLASMLAGCVSSV